MDARRRHTDTTDAVPAPVQLRMHRLVSVWAVTGVALSLGMAIFRLGKRALALREQALTPFQWAVFLVCVLAFAYGEGYRALHLRFVPRVIARAVALASVPGLGVWRALLAPLYAFGLIQREREVVVRAWMSVALIALAVVIVRALPDPWRGIIDASVVLALMVGVVSLGVSFAARLRSRP